PDPATRVPHRDHHHPPGQLATPVVRLHRHPPARARVFYNILTCLRKRHSEAHRRLRVEAQLGRQDGRRALLNLAHHRVHVLGRAHRVTGSSTSLSSAAFTRGTL